MIISHYLLLSLPYPLPEQSLCTASLSLYGALHSYGSSTDPSQIYETSSTLIIFFATQLQLQGIINFNNVYFFTNGTGNLTLLELKISSGIQTCLQKSSPPIINPLLLDQNAYTKNVPLNLLQFVNTVTGNSSFAPSNILILIEQYIKPIYTVFLFTEDLLQISQDSTINAARIGIFANTLLIDITSKVTANGLGCYQGIGVGMLDNQIAGFCPGSGGSYGGLGGPGISQLRNGSLQYVCNQLIGITYGSKHFPSLEGSGGGGADSSLVGGRGGGVIVIGAKKGIIDGNISSNGVIGNVPSTSKTGSGSGGSIQIHTLSRLLGQGFINADGSPQTTQGGGFGKEYLSSLKLILL